MVEYANVSHGQPSSIGSVYADSPGLLRENGYTSQFIVSPQTNSADLAICSGSADSDVTDYQPVLPVLGPWFEGYTLPIQIEGPAKVWLETLSAGAAPKTYNRITLNILEIRRSNIDGL
mgnify:CR=1 FL=1